VDPLLPLSGVGAEPTWAVQATPCSSTHHVQVTIHCCGQLLLTWCPYSVMAYTVSYSSLKSNTVCGEVQSEVVCLAHTMCLTLTLQPPCSLELPKARGLRRCKIAGITHAETHMPPKVHNNTPESCKRVCIAFIISSTVHVICESVNT
jgi:hypothetical protein